MLKQKNGNPSRTPEKTSPVPNPLPEVKNTKEKQEQDEVAGRHKNDGQMGHKGAR